MHKLKKGQSAIEFLILVGAVIFFVVGFLIAAQISVSDRTRENKNQVLNEVAFTIQDEINIAQEAPDGYYREFRLSPTILTSDYTITHDESGLIGVKTNDERYATAVSAPPTMGQAVPGDNEIRSENGKVCLNVPYAACISCGNGLREDHEPLYDDEECDGSDYNPYPNDPDCTVLGEGFTSGKLKCYVDCTIDRSDCS